MVGVSLVVSVFTGAAASAASLQQSQNAAPSAAATIDLEVAQDMKDDGEAAFWVHFAARPSLTKQAAVKDWDARGKAVYTQLSKTAATSQAAVLADLTKQNVPHQAFHIVNAIKVESGDAALLKSLAASPGVDRIEAPFEVEEPDDVTVATNVPAADEVEWGVADIKADKVWSDYGVNGQGIVVGSIDTGVQYDHPALVSHYRGTRADGTFDHNYNWLDVSGGQTAPHDESGHGTHTMGTMVGGDGGANNIGVAPGATWIAANGCCPSDAALIKAMEWMLAPTDSNGENPDASKRPNIVNNSWGSSDPSNDPFGEELQAAWTASGIFGVFANGNSGPGCNTAGSPGSRTQNYSVGNYTADHVIADSSSRGSGQDGEIKPNIAAPGTNVRSSIPGSGYGTKTGTSMAAPHAAGAVALLWSGAPDLIGDIEATRELLDGSAIDTEDLQCGGTAARNNVFGEGRLDVLAAMDRANTSTSGTLSGVITDTATGKPIVDAEITAVGELTRTVTTDAEGKYTLLLPEGPYKVDVAAFGYEAGSAAVTITAKTTTPQSFALARRPTVAVTGTVTDGSGHGWPVYAQITANGTPINAFTDPKTGEYSFQAPTGSTYKVTANAQYPGYVSATKEVVVGSTAPAPVDLAVNVDAAACTAPGYQHESKPAINEGFDGATTPQGWTITNESSKPSQVWTFDKPGGRGNNTGGQGNFAVASPYILGPTKSNLVTPSVDLSEATDPVLEFKHAYIHNDDPASTAVVDLSVDGGATWTPLRSFPDSANGSVSLTLPTAAGKSDVKVRFRYASISWWWQVDEVFLGDRPCVPMSGGLVLGNVTDATTGEGIVGAQVTNKDSSTEKATTAATVADKNLDDGFYWMFSSSPATHPFEAIARRYTPARKDVTVVKDKVSVADFALNGGKLAVTPSSLETKVALGKSASKKVTVTNKGAATVNVSLQEVRGNFEILRADGTKESMAKIAGAEGAPEIERKVATSIAQAAPTDPKASDEAAPSPTAAPWVDLAPAGTPVMDNRVVSLDGDWYSIGGSTAAGNVSTVLRYDQLRLSWVPVAKLPVATSNVAAGVIDGQIVVSGGWTAGGVTKSTYAYDPATNAWTRKADAPVAVSGAGFGVSEGKLHVVGGCTTSACEPMTDSAAAYDLATNTWSSLAPFPLAVGFLSCGGAGDVYCAGGTTGTVDSKKAYAYDTRLNLWTEIASLPVEIWGANPAAVNGTFVINGGVQGAAVSNRTFSYVPGKDAWDTLPNSNTATYRGGSACGFVKVGGAMGGSNRISGAEQLPGFDGCDGESADVEWLSSSVEQFTLKPGKSATISVTTDGKVAQPGTYSAAIRLASDAPGEAAEVPVTMTVDPPRTWGKLRGTVTGISCADGTASPLAGAAVDITPTRGTEPGWYLTTNDDGGYATWFDAGVGKVKMLVVKDGWRTAMATTKLTKGTTLTKDFALVKPSC